MLTLRQHETLAFVDARLRETGISPSFDEIRSGLGLRSKAGVHRLIRALEERGFIRRLPNHARALEVVRMPSGDVRVLPPLPRPPPRPSIHNPLDWYGPLSVVSPERGFAPLEVIEAPEAFAPLSQHFALDVRGDYLVHSGIFDGDRLVLIRTHDIEDGDLILLNYGSAIRLRVARVVDRMAGFVGAGDERSLIMPGKVKVLGRVVFLYRAFHREV